MAIADLLAKLVELKNQLVANLSSMGVTADESEKLNTLVPKVLKCKADVIWSQGTVSTEVTSVKIPSGVTSIGAIAFGDCTSLASIRIPNSVTSIGGSAFNRCSSLAGITIPDSVTSIAINAFNGCTSLASISVSEKNENYSSVDGILFNKNKTELIKYPVAKTISEYSVPDSVTRIGAIAFGDCTSLASIRIPNSVTSIGGSAFNRCSSLANIYYKGTEEQWNAIAKGDSWNRNMGSNVEGGTVVTYNYTG